jgi:DNA primase small subunit
MDERTLDYLERRFGDHYRRVDVGPPPAAADREWGYIPFTTGGTRMVRHRSILDLGEFGESAELDEVLARQRPRHVYFSAARYDDPGAGEMSEKGWRGADLVFDIDADHLPGVDEETPYAEMLATGKAAVEDLLDLLDRDFGFDDMTVVFSGGRGYHVHVRDDGVQELDRDERREVVDYVLGEGVDLETLVRSESVSGVGRKTPADKRTLRTDGGWGRRTHERLLAVLDSVVDLDDEDALARLTEYEGVGQGKAEAVLNAARRNRGEIAAGNVDVHSAMVSFARAVLEETVAADRAPVDEPVTTDLNRLIRLPGSLHGGSGLAVTRIDRGDLASFDPLVDAVPETFRGGSTTVDVTEGGPVTVAGDSFNLSAGEQSLPEPVAVFLLARGRAAYAEDNE